MTTSLVQNSQAVFRTAAAVRSHWITWASTATSTLDAFSVWLLVHFWSLNIQKPFTAPKTLQPLHSVAQPHLVLGCTVYKTVRYTIAALSGGWTEPLELSVLAKLVFQMLSSSSGALFFKQRGTDVPKGFQQSVTL